MPAPVLGLLLLVCPSSCTLPLPGAVLEVRAAAAGQWQWCLRGDDWRLCADDWQPRTRQRIEQALRQLRATTTPRAPAGDPASKA